MKYKRIVEGRFLNRPNRFIARVLVGGVEETVHVKNTGRCKELLVEGAFVYLYESDNPNRKTKYDLIAVEKVTNNGTVLINMDSQIPNDVVAEWLPKSGLFCENVVIKREVTYNKSRFDFYIEDGESKAFIEVKGVTLENDGVASFPDAPTQRGVKHINELISAVENGYKTYVVFVIQMKCVHKFTPNDATHKEFGDALHKAQKRGVEIIAVDCVVKKDEIYIDKSIPVEL